MLNDRTVSNNPNLALRFSPLDKAALVELSQLLKMNQTETLRLLVRETLVALKKRERKPVSTAILKTRDVKPDEAVKISPALRQRIEREIRLAKSGDLLAGIWIKQHMRLVVAYAEHVQK